MAWVCNGRGLGRRDVCSSSSRNGTIAGLLREERSVERSRKNKNEDTMPSKFSYSSSERARGGAKIGRHAADRGCVSDSSNETRQIMCVGPVDGARCRRYYVRYPYSSRDGVRFLGAVDSPWMCVHSRVQRE